MTDKQAFVAILSGNVYPRKCPIELDNRDARITEIYESASKTKRLVISF